MDKLKKMIKAELGSDEKDKGTVQENLHKIKEILHSIKKEQS